MNPRALPSWRWPGPRQTQQNLCIRPCEYVLVSASPSMYWARDLQPRRHAKQSANAPMHRIIPSASRSNKQPPQPFLCGPPVACTPSPLGKAPYLPLRRASPRTPETRWSPDLFEGTSGSPCNLIVGPREFFRGRCFRFCLSSPGLLVRGTAGARGVDLPVAGKKSLKEPVCVCVRRRRPLPGGSEV